MHLISPGFDSSAEMVQAAHRLLPEAREQYCFSRTDLGAANELIDYLDQGDRMAAVVFFNVDAGKLMFAEMCHYPFENVAE